MNAQPIQTGPGDSYDWRRDELESQDASIESATEEMLAEPSYIDEWIGSDYPPEIAALLSRLLSDGLPSRNKSETDDALCDALDNSIETLRESFNAWASRSTFGSPPVDAYMQSRNEP